MANQIILPHTSEDMSENEQMYLVALAQLQEEIGSKTISLTALANALSVQPVSVNQMVHKLRENGLVTYTPYKGVAFTDAGSLLVQRILRYRRLWEVFLVQHLKMSLDEADAQACRLEHITTDEVANRLELFLGDPIMCLHGHPIPKLDDRQRVPDSFPLTQLHLHHEAILQDLPANPTIRAFLTHEGLVPGAIVTLFAVGSTGDLLVSVGSHQVLLSSEIGGQIMVVAEQRTLIPNPTHIKNHSEEVFRP